MLKYSCEDIRDEKGFSARIKVAYQELAIFKKSIEEGLIFKAYTSSLKYRGRLIRYLSKSICTYDATGIKSSECVWNALLLINIFDCIARGKSVQKDARVIIYLEKRMWWEAIQEYGNRICVEIRALPRRTKIDFTLSRAQRFFIRKHLNNLVGTFLPRVQYHSQESTQPSVATEYYGHLNLDRPEFYSDLFFFHNSELDGSELKVLFRDRSLSLNPEMYEELNRYHVIPLILDRRASEVPEAPVHKYNLKLRSQKLNPVHGNSDEHKCMRDYAAEFEWLKSYWRDIFYQHNIRIYIHWYKYDSEHMAIADAIKDLGGIMALYQRSFEAQPTAETTLSLDIEFGFSPHEAQLEFQNRSQISYHVATGYPSDFRFPLLRNEANRIREELRENGAKHVLAYFDENTIEDSRWFASHELAKKNYAFILNKLLTNPWLGLVLKPKSPKNLRQRLGPVCDTLDAALASKRCHFFSGGVLQGSYPPAVAALAADLSIHDSLAAATAGLESALCGVPTLLLDFEGWPENKLYKLGVGNVVFNDWETAWDACQDYFFSKNTSHKIGNWSLLLNELDPFRDGRAAERIGNYLKWLLDGFKAGLDRQTVMADAAERYGRQWGHDKITSINIG